MTVSCGLLGARRRAFCGGATWAVEPARWCWPKPHWRMRAGCASFPTTMTRVARVRSFAPWMRECIPASQKLVCRVPAVKTMLLAEERGLPIGGPFTAK